MTSNRWSGGAVAVLVALLVFASPALAEPPTDADRQEAARLLGLGIQLQEGGRHLEALRIFDDAHQRVPHVKIRYYTLLSFHALGRHADAMKVLEEIYEAPELDRRHRRRLDELRQTLQAALQAVQVRIEADGVVGARVFVNDREVGITPYLAELAPGAYVIRIQMDGYEPTQRAVTIQPTHETVQVSMAMTAAADPDPDPNPDPDPAPDPQPDPTPAPDGSELILPWTLIGVGIAAVVGSTGYWVKHAVDNSNLEPGDEQSPINLILGGVAVGVGAGLIVTGVLLLPEPAESEPGVDGVGILSIEGGGVIFATGRF